MNHKGKGTRKKKLYIQTTACLKRRCKARINEIYIAQCGQKQNAHCKDGVRVKIGTTSEKS